MDGWVGHVGWPIADVWPTKWSSVQLAVWRRTGKVRQSKTGVLPLCYAANYAAKSVPSTWKGLFFSEKLFKLHLNTYKCRRCLLLNTATTLPGPLGVQAWFTNKKVKTSHFVISRRRASFDFYQILQDDGWPLCHRFTCLTFLGPISSLADKGHRKFDWKCKHRSKLFIILTFTKINESN